MAVVGKALGGFFGGKKPPKPTTPATVLSQTTGQQQADVGLQQKANFNNQGNIYGNQLTYSYDPQTGKYTQNIAAGGPGQEFQTGFSALGQKGLGIANNMADQMAGGQDLTSMDAFNKAKGFYDQNTAGRQQRETDALENKLRNQGLDPTSEAYKSQMNDLGLQHNEAYNSFMNQAQNQFWNQGQQGANNDISRLWSLTQPGASYGMNAATNSTFGQMPGINVANVAGSVPGMYQNYDASQLAAYNAQQANSPWANIAKLGGSILGMPMQQSTSFNPSTGTYTSAGGGSLGGNMIGGLANWWNGKS